ncbi:hypothetical protein [Thermodesulfitimonas sp.]
MFAKKRPRCNQWSYSAADIGDWFCPYCRHNLKDVPAVVAGTVDEAEKDRKTAGTGNGTREKGRL